MEKNKFGVIYKITNSINNKVYIGQTTQNPKKRFKQHMYEFKRNKQPTPISKAINKYGIKNLIQEVIHECYSKSELNQMEAYYIELYDSCNRNKGYNICERSEDGRLCVSEETKQKISKRAKEPYRIVISVNNGKNNRGKSRLNSSSKYCGVTFNKGKWCSSIKIDKKSCYLGTFLLEEDAGKAYDIAAIKYCGIHSRLNFPELLELYLKNEIKLKKINKLNCSRKNKKSNSKIRGVSFSSRKNNWVVQIKGFKNKRFKIKEEAENYANECRKLQQDIII